MYGIYAYYTVLPNHIEIIARVDTNQALCYIVIGRDIMVKKTVLKLLLLSVVFFAFAAVGMCASAAETIGVPTGRYFKLKNASS